MKRMLINATQKEEVRIALVDGQKIYDLDIESVGHEQKKSNIYKGVITRIEHSLEVAFVNYGTDRSGFLPLKEIAPEYFHVNPQTGEREISEGTEVIVQIDKEERGRKGASITTYISLAGSYIVLMPNHPKSVGVSRRIDGENRKELKQILDSLEIPEGMGVIVRTAGLGKSAEELKWDLDFLIKLWTTIKNAADARPAPFLIYKEGNIVSRALRDYVTQDIGEILIDNKEIFLQVQEQIKTIRPDFLSKVRLYEDEVPLFSHYQIESQIESAYEREVPLPSGGSIVIDPTEALTSIDVNSAKATKGGDIEETALQTNIEAAEEIARQLRLRDIGGLIVVDFIDMKPIKNQKEIVNRMWQAVKIDRAKIDMERISKFGLLELSRQRIRPSLGESTSHICPRCCGKGTIRDNASLALSILRLIEEEAMKDNTNNVCARVPLAIAAYLMNEKRESMNAIEKRHDVHIFVIPDDKLESPNYNVYRIKENESQNINSFGLMTKSPADLGISQNNFPAAAQDRSLNKTTVPRETTQAAVDINTVVKDAAPPPKKVGLFSSILNAISSLLKGSDNKEKGKNGKKDGYKGHGKGNKYGKNSRKYNQNNKKAGVAKDSSNKQVSDNVEKKSRVAKNNVSNAPTQDNSNVTTNTQKGSNANLKQKNRSRKLDNRPVIEETVEVKKSKRNNYVQGEEQNVVKDNNVEQQNAAKPSKERRERKPKQQHTDKHQHNKVPESRVENVVTDSAVVETVVDKVVSETPVVSNENNNIPVRIGCVCNVEFVSAPMTEPSACDLPATEPSIGVTTEKTVFVSDKAAGFNAITNIASVEMTEPSACDLPSVEVTLGRDDVTPASENFKVAGFAAIQNIASVPMTEPKSCDEEVVSEVVVEQQTEEYVAEAAETPESTSEVENKLE